MLASLADVAQMTPRSDDLLKSKLSVRDVVLFVVGALGMYGMQIGTQWELRADIRELKALFEKTTTTFQSQIDEWRQQTKLNEYNIMETQKEVAELKGIMTGAGLTPTPKR